ncbi:hypothetical protein ACFY1L_01670 [Streptomyces sp. NPDC001663]|uniref:hypothetical protein n=1 Tax=Streptomyces sp. NPDC001663 TaxID=3364597 RepID=UPI003692A26D
MTETAPAAAVSAETVEIRVHGVSGTPVESLLEIRSVRQVDGDDLAGFYRLPEAAQPSAVPCEAFRWGAMTSGSVSKAVWLLLAPLGVINLAGFTLPGPVGEKPTRREERTLGAAEALLRLLALGMTLLLVTAVTFVAVDLAAWQCGGDAQCAKKLPFLSGPRTGWHLRLLCAAAVPAVVVAVLDLISSRVYLYPPPPPLPESDSDPRPVRDLGDRQFWMPKPRTALLRRLHLSASLAVIAMLIAHLSTHYVSGLDAAQGWSRGFLWTLFWIGVVITGSCLVATAAGRMPGERNVNAVDDPNAVPVLCSILYGAAWAVFAATAVTGAFWGGRVVRRTGRLPVWLTGFDWAFQAYYAYAAGLLVLLAAANAVLRLGYDPAHRVPTPYRRLCGGMTCTVLTGFAVLLATGFTSGLILQTARLFGHRDALTDTQQPLDLPDLFHVTTLLWGLLVVPLVALAVVCLVLRAVRPRWPSGVSMPQRIKDDYKDQRLTERTVKGIRVAWQRARLKYPLPNWLFAVGAVGWVAAVAQGVLGCYAVLPGKDPVPGWLDDHLYRGRAASAFFHFVDEALGTWTLTALAAALVFLGTRAFRSPVWRRGVGIVWDLLAFWPRWTHPIVPPPYGGRAVLGLVRRVEEKTVGQGKVVLSGHSQGSLICAAAVLAMEETDRRRVALLTYGSQLMWAYARLFPAYVGHPTLKDLYTTKLHERWHNLHRWTDPLGGPVLAHPAKGPVDPVLPATDWKTINDDPVSGGGDPPTGCWWRRFGPEYQLHDPRTVDPSDNAPATPMLGHSDYYDDPAFDAVVRELAAAIDRPRRAPE